MSPKLLLFDSNPGIAELLGARLQSAGYDVRSITDVMAAVNMTRSEAPSLIVIDPALPKLPGFGIVRRIKNDPETRHVPLIILTAAAAEEDRILGFELGADDFIAKPFSTAEVLLRVKISLARAMPQPPEEKIVMDDLVLNRCLHEVSIQNKPIVLSLLEFKLLEMFMRHAGCIVDRKTLLIKVWEMSGNLDTRTVDTHVARLRRKLGSWSDQIESVRGFGYRFNTRPASALPNSQIATCNLKKRTASQPV
jgi:two-component system phosphate regulon response regulator PhoB